MQRRVTCGQLPPNCDKGHGFVHDPHVAGVPEVKAQIRLMFRTGSNNQTVVATRTLQLTNTRTKAGLKSTFKALENLIRFKERDGENTTANRRCADMDNAIPALMGVPRPILEHVIFCHQEDSNWPLAERILLKKRFDEIFGSSRYTKALEAIEKQRKEILKEAKEKGHVLALISKDRDNVLELRKEMNRLTEIITNLGSRIKEFDRQVERKEGELDALQRLENEHRDKLFRLDNLRTELGRLSNSLGADSGAVRAMSKDQLEQQRTELGLRMVEFETKKSDISLKISQEKSLFESLVKERTGLVNRLKSIRNSQMECSNLQDLIRLKSNELSESVSASKAGSFLPESFQFSFDQPGISIREMEQIVNAKTTENECSLALLAQDRQVVEQHVSALENGFQQLQRENMQIVSDCNLLESKISSSVSEQQAIDMRIASIVAHLSGDSSGFGESIEDRFNRAIQQLDKDLNFVASEKRILSGSSSAENLRLELTDMISDSVSSVALMHLSPEELVTHLETKKQSIYDKIESSLKSLACACPSQTPGATQLQASPEIELAGARQTLTLFTSMKSKSLAESKCNLCRQRISSVQEFEAAIDRFTKKLPEIISANEAKLASSVQTSTGAIDELRRTLIPELVETEKCIARIRALMEAATRLTTQSSEQPIDRELQLEQLEQREETLSSQKSEAAIQRDSYKALTERKAAVETVLDDFRLELVALKDGRVESKRVEMEKARETLTVQRQQLNDLIQRISVEKSGLDSALNSMRNSFQIIFQIASQVDGLRAKMGSGASVDPAVVELASLEARESDLGNQLTRTMNSLSALEDERTRADQDLIFTKSEVDVVGRKVQFKNLEAELGILETAIGGPSLASAQDTSTLQNEVKRLRDDRSKLIGETTQVQHQISEIERKLNTSSFSDVDEKYRQAFCCVESHTILARDVQRYHQALDRALMSYHSHKMGEINELIRDLWGRIYKGTDIDYIAIRSDTETEDAENLPSSAAGPAKRSYNYRVVMVKGDVELEMRGRCSAGQKVIACLIIRLALAESFCLSCGILALDEPTTNLDRSNIGGLAEALADLIAARREQRNFQLIIITHDESFVNMLGNLRACDHFYRVSKNEFGHSTLSRSHIHEIHTRAAR